MIPGESYVSSTNDSLHGKYYSMASVLDTTNKLAPNGWHIPDSIDIINFGKVYQEDRKKLGYLSEDYYNYKTKKFEPGGYIWSTRLNYLGRPFFVSISSTNQVGFVDPINNCFLNVRCLRD